VQSAVNRSVVGSNPTGPANARGGIDSRGRLLFVRKADRVNMEEETETPLTQQERMQKLSEMLASMPYIEPEHYSWAIHKLEAEFPGLKFSYVGGACPTQADATYNELAVYARYRWDIFSITMGKNNGARKLPDNDYFYEVENPPEADGGGFLTADEFYKLFSKGFRNILTGS
jgi:hypothetical protein